MAFDRDVKNLWKGHHNPREDLHREGRRGWERAKIRSRVVYTIIWWRCQFRVLVGKLPLKVVSTCLWLDDGGEGRSNLLLVDIVPVDGLEEHMRLDLLCISLSSTQSVNTPQLVTSSFYICLKPTFCSGLSEVVLQVETCSPVSVLLETLPLPVGQQHTPTLMTSPTLLPLTYH